MESIEEVMGNYLKRELPEEEESLEAMELFAHAIDFQVKTIKQLICDIQELENEKANKKVLFILEDWNGYVRKDGMRLEIANAALIGFLYSCFVQAKQKEGEQ